jgi:hypothetical protein
MEIDFVCIVLLITLYAMQQTVKKLFYNNLLVSWFSLFQYSLNTTSKPILSSFTTPDNLEQSNVGENTWLKL